MDGGTSEETAPAKRNPIYIDDFTDVARDFSTLRGRFSGDGQWLGALATAATKDGETLRMRIGPSWAAGLVSRGSSDHLASAPKRRGARAVPGLGAE